MTAKTLAERITALESWLHHRGWTIDQRLAHGRIYAHPNQPHRLLIADAATPDADYHLTRSYELLARWEGRPQTLLTADIDRSSGTGRLVMYFEGDPVIDHQIEASFAAKMLMGSRTLIAALHRRQTIAGPLASTGALAMPRRVMLASTPAGSFGFELVEAPDPQRPLLPDADPDSLAPAMDEVVQLFTAAHRADDLGPLLVEQDARVMRNLRVMLDDIRKAGASLRLVGPTRAVDLSSADIGAARDRLAEVQRSVRETTYQGRLDGILTHDVAFELLADARLTDDRADPITPPELIKGSIARAIDPDQIRRWSTLMQSPVRARVREVTTTHPGRDPRLARALLALRRPDEPPPIDPDPDPDLD